MLNKIKTQLQIEANPLLGHKYLKKYSVVIPLIKQHDGTIAILFEKRANNLRRQPSEISFPGGKIDKSDIDAKEAAIRETTEELGIDKQNIEIISELGAFLPARHSVIYPFVAHLITDKFNPNPDEVEEIFMVPLEFFLKNEPIKHQINLRVEAEDNFPFHLIPKGKEYPWGNNQMIEYFYQYNNYVIWGITAHILYNFILMLKD